MQINVFYENNQIASLFTAIDFERVTKVTAVLFGSEFKLSYIDGDNVEVENQFDFDLMLAVAKEEGKSKLDLNVTKTEASKGLMRSQSEFSGGRSAVREECLLLKENTESLTIVNENTIKVK